MKSIALLIIALSLATTVLAAGEDANYWLAQTQSDYQNGSYSLAVQDIDEYLAIKADDTWAWSFRANILLKMKRYSEAVDSFDELLKLDKSNAQAYNDRALILSGGMRRNDEALESLEKALEIEPKNANYWFNKGIILEAMKRSDEALQAYEQATSLDPSFEKAWYQQIYTQSIDSSLMKRYGTLDEQADPILFLASDDASYITGVELRVQAMRSPLLEQLLGDGHAKPGAHGIGLATDPQGRLFDVHGQVQCDLHAIGSLRIGEAWESIAVPELRMQAESIARTLSGDAVLPL